MSLKFFRRVAFGLSPNDKKPDEPLPWALNQLNTIPEFLWPGLKKKELFEGRDLNSTIDSRAVYNSAMSMCFNKDPEFLRREVFWGDDLPNLTEELFKI